MKFSIETSHFVELLKNSHSLDHVFLLKLIQQNIDINELCLENIKIANLRQGLVRKGFITENNLITTIGTELIIFTESKGEKKYVKRKPANAEFDVWWKAYPGTNTFTHKGKTFKGDRSLRVGKEECRLKFDKILIEGDYTAKQLIEALEFDVLQKKDVSILEGTNKLKYMQNSLTYLNQRTFEPFIELLQTNPSLLKQTVSSGSTDI
jgi:hypothetical protein